MSHKPFAERLREDRRLVLLRVLADQVQYMANSSVLTMALSSWGHAVSRDQVKTELRWLEEQSLVRIDELPADVLLAHLTERGHDVAAGRAVVPGVSRPGA
jgi:hypothetical protein